MSAGSTSVAPCILHHVERLFHQRVHGVAEAEIFSRHADARALETVGIAILRVVGLRFAGARRRRRVVGIDAGQRAQKNRRVAHRAAHGPGAVLAMRNRDDAAAADQAHRRLDSRQAVRRRRTHDRTVGFRPNAGGSQVRGNAGARARTRSARIAVERIGIFRQASASAPSAGRVAGTNIRPLAEIRLAQDHRTCRAQPLRHERILRRLRADQRQRSGRGHHAIRRIDVVFDQHRDAMQRATRAFGLALLIERVGNGERIRIQFDDRVHRRAALVDLVDARKIFLDQRPSGEFARTSSHPAVPES